MSFADSGGTGTSTDYPVPVDPNAPGVSFADAGGTGTDPAPADPVDAGSGGGAAGAVAGDPARQAPMDRTSSPDGVGDSGPSDAATSVLDSFSASVPVSSEKKRTVADGILAGAGWLDDQAEGVDTTGRSAGKGVDALDRAAVDAQGQAQDATDAIRALDLPGKQREGASLEGEWADIQKRIDAYNRAGVYDAEAEGSLDGELADLRQRTQAYEATMAAAQQTIDVQGYDSKALAEKRAVSDETGAIQQAGQTAENDEAGYRQRDEMLVNDATDPSVPAPMTPGEYRSIVGPAANPIPDAERTPIAGPVDLRPAAGLADPDAPLVGPSLPGADQSIRQVASDPSTRGFYKSATDDSDSWHPFTAEQAPAIQQQANSGAIRVVADTPDAVESVLADQVRPGGTDPITRQQVVRSIGALALAVGIVPGEGAAGVAGFSRTVAQGVLERTGLLAGSVNVGADVSAFAQIGARIARPVELAIRAGSVGVGGYQGVQGVQTVRHGDVLGGALEILGGAVTALMGVGLGRTVGDTLSGTASATDLGILPAGLRAPSVAVSRPLLSLEGAGALGKARNIGLAALWQGVPGFVPYTPDALQHPLGFLLDNTERAMDQMASDPTAFYGRLFDLVSGKVGRGDVEQALADFYRQTPEEFYRQAGIQRAAQESDPFVGATPAWELAGMAGSLLLGNAVALAQGHSVYGDPVRRFTEVYQQQLDAGLSPEAALDASLGQTSDGLAYFLYTVNPRNPAYTFLGMPALEHITDMALSGMGRKALDVDAYLSGRAVYGRMAKTDPYNRAMDFAFGLSKESGLRQLKTAAFRNLDQQIPTGGDAARSFAYLTDAARAFANKNEARGQAFVAQLAREVGSPVEGGWEATARMMADTARLRYESKDLTGKPFNADAYFGAQKGGINRDLSGAAPLTEGQQRVIAQRGGNILPVDAARVTAIEGIVSQMADQWRLTAGMPLGYEGVDVGRAKTLVLRGLDGMRTLMLAVAAPAVAGQKFIDEDLRVMAQGGKGASRADSNILLRRSGDLVQSPNAGDQAAGLGKYDRRGSAQSAYALHGASVPGPLLIKPKPDGPLKQYIENLIGATTHHAQAGAYKISSDLAVGERGAHLDRLEAALRGQGVADGDAAAIRARLENMPRQHGYLQEARSVRVAGAGRAGNAQVADTLRVAGVERQALERNVLVRGDAKNARAIGNFEAKSRLGELATFVYPFLEFHLNAKRIAVTNIARNPLYGVAMARYLQENQDDYGRVPVIGGYIADLSKYYTGLGAVKFGLDYAQYIAAVLGSTNSPAQDALKIAARPIAGPGALAHMWSPLDNALHGLATAPTVPVKQDTVLSGGGNWLSSAIGRGADQWLGADHPTARDRVRGAGRWAGDPVGTAFDAVPHLGMPTKQRDIWNGQFNYAIPEIAARLGWDHARAAAALAAPDSPDGRLLRNEYLKQVDKVGMASIIPAPFSKAEAVDSPARQQRFADYAREQTINADEALSKGDDRLAAIGAKGRLGQAFKDLALGQQDVREPVFAPRDKPSPGLADLPNYVDARQRAAQIASDGLGSDPLAPASLAYQREVQDKKDTGILPGRYFSTEQIQQAEATPGGMEKLTHSNDLIVAEDALLLARREYQIAVEGGVPTVIDAAADKVHLAEAKALALGGSRAPTAGMQGLAPAVRDPDATDIQKALGPDGAPTGFPVSENGNPFLGAEDAAYIRSQGATDEQRAPWSAASVLASDTRRQAFKDNLPVEGLTPFEKTTATEHQMTTDAALGRANAVSDDLRMGRELAPDLRGKYLDYQNVKQSVEGVPIVGEHGERTTPRDFLKASGYNQLGQELSQAIADKDEGRAAAIEGRRRQIESVPGMVDYFAAVQAAALKDEKRKIDLRRDDALLNPDTQAALDPLNRPRAEYLIHSPLPGVEDRLMTPGVAANPVPGGPPVYGEAPAARNQSGYTVKLDREYIDTFTDQQRAAYDGYEALQKSDVGQRYDEMVHQFEGVRGGYGTPAGKAWFLANRDAYNAAKGAYFAALGKIQSETGEDPRAAVNLIRDATGGQEISDAPATASKAGGKSGHGKGWVDYGNNPPWLNNPDYRGKDGLTSAERLARAEAAGLAKFDARTQWQKDLLKSIGPADGVVGADGVLARVSDFGKHTPALDFQRAYSALPSWEKADLKAKIGGLPPKGSDDAVYAAALAAIGSTTGATNRLDKGQLGPDAKLPGGLYGDFTAPVVDPVTGESLVAAKKTVMLGEDGQPMRSVGGHGGNRRTGGGVLASRGPKTPRASKFPPKKPTGGKTVHFKKGVTKGVRTLKGPGPIITK